MSFSELSLRMRETASHLLEAVIRRRSRPQRASGFDAMLLEDRVMLSATPMPDVVVDPEAAGRDEIVTADPFIIDSDVGSDGSDEFRFSDSSSESGRDAIVGINPLFVVDPSPDGGSAAETTRLELVFLDTAADDYQQLLDDLLSNQDPHRALEIHLLEPDRDGIEQISEVLAGHADVDSIHLVSHGAEGTVTLGSTRLNIDNLAGYAGEIAGWNSALRSDADLMIYGCDLAATTDGQALTEALSVLCDCDAAASIDDTGHALLGGDWDLEYRAGSIETDIAFSVELQQDWLHVLAVPTAADNTVVTQPDVDYTFTTADFNYDDLDGDPLTKIQITDLETVGALQLSGVDVVIDQEISAADIAAGNLKFVPNPGETGTGYDSFEFRVHDGTQYSAPVSYTGILSATFPSNAEGFTYADDVFGTSQPARATGTYEPAGGFTNGGLRVYISGDSNSNPMSGGWSDTFNLAQPETVTVSLRYRLQIGEDSEPHEYSEVILDIDGTRYGGDLNSSLLHVDGISGPNGDYDSGWIYYESNIALGAGNHTLTAGLYANELSGSNEWTEASFDDISVGVADDYVMTLDVVDTNIAPSFGRLGFTSHTITTAADGARSVTTADVDGDGDLDVLSASQDDDKIAWYENDGSENFAAHTISTAANGAQFVTTADVDGDGDLDVLSASFNDNKIAWYENDGSENFTERTITTAANGAWSVTTADVDGDGDLDVLSASFNDNKIAWYENDGSENFTAHTITTAAIGAISVTTADVDGDGDLDVLSASEDDDTVAWYENDGSENFTERIITTAANGANSVTTADVDGDGDLDVLSASEHDDTIAWYENDGSENFTARTITTAADGAWSVTTADVDGDGDLDVLSASRLDDTIAWYENDGSENFTAHTITTAADGAWSVTTADVDGDGDLDVLSASRNDDTIAWYENDSPTSLDGAPTFVEDGPAVVLDADVVVSDVELDALNSSNGNYDGASVTLVRNGGAASEDVFSFNDGNGITLSGGNLIKNTQIVASFDTTSTPGELVITFTDANGEIPTSVDTDNVLRQITYSNSSDTPPASAQIDWTFDDGNTGAQGAGGALQVVGSTTVSITAVNDVPVATANTVSTSEDMAYTFNSGDFTFTDPESDGLVSVTITNQSLAGGTLELGGLTVNNGDTITAAQIGTLVYTPANNANGAPLATFDFTVNDAGLGVVAAQMDIDITAVNDVPVATVNTVSTGEDTAYTFASGDFTFTDVESDSLVSVTITNQSLAGGTLELGGLTVNNGDTITAAQIGTLVYTPANHANGAPLATFDFTVNDAGLGVVAAQMDIDITAVNDVPVATVNTVSTGEDTAYTFASGDFTFTDVESDSLVSVTITNQSLAGGTLELGGFTVNNGDTITAAQIGTLVYTPANHANGAPLATFDFTVNDAGLGVVAAQMDIDITAVNDVPVATVNTVSTSEDTAYTFNSGDFTFTDPESDSLVSVTITNQSLAGGTLELGGATVNNGDTIAAAQIGTLVYTPANHANGAPLATFDFTVNDAGLGVVAAQMDIDITAVNDVPVATVNTVSTSEDTAYTFNSGDFTFTDVESDGLVSVTITNQSLAGGTLELGGLTVNNGDTITAAQIGTLVYTPANHANGAPLATFDFTVNDAGLGLVAAQMDIDITAVNDVPVATVNTVSTSEDTAYTFNSGDFTFTDVESDGLVSVTITNQSLAGGTLELGGATVNNGDTITAAQIGTLVYTPANNANGAPLATFDFTVNDAGLGLVAAQMDIDITAVNDVPVATANTVSTSEDTAYTFNSGDFTFTDPESDGLVSVTITNQSLAGGTLELGGATVNNGDTITAAQIGTLVYTPANNANGAPLATFDFTVNDAGLGVVAAQMDIDITPVNDVPVATPNTVSTGEDTAYTFASGDFTFTDPESDSLVSVTITNQSLAGGTLELGGATVNNGDTITAAQIGTLVYTPANHANGAPLATFDFTVNDAGLGVVAAQMDIDITAVNDVPVATVNTVSTGEDTAYTFASGDFTFTDVESDSLVSVTITNQSLAGGTLELGGLTVNNGDTITAAQIGTLVYTPANHANGAPLATFDFTVNDAGLGVVAAQMDIDITAVNDVPVATVNTVSTGEDTAYTFASGDFTFTDVESDSLVSVTITNQSLAGGTLELGGFTVNNGDTITAAQIGTLVYTPANHANGAPLATFDFTVNDAGLGVVAAQMDVDITAVNDVPVATANTVSTSEDTAYTFNSGDFTFTDVESDSLVSVTITNQSLAGGTLELGGLTVNNGDTITAAQIGTLVYTPANNANGAPLATFDFTVNDAGLGIVAAQMDIDVTAVNDAPVAANDSSNVNEGAAINIDLAGNDSDADDGLDLASLSIVSGPINGSLVVNPDGTVDYTHDGSETISDSFTYTIDDNSGVTSNVATVDLTINSPDDSNVGLPPVDDDPPPNEDDTAPDEERDVPEDLIAPPSTPADSDQPPSSTRRRDVHGGREEATIQFVAASPLPDSSSGIEEFVFRNAFGEHLRSGTKLAAQVIAEHLNFEFATDNLFEQLDKLSDELSDDFWFQEFVVGSATLTSAALTVGYVYWTIQSGSLLAGAASALPTWTTFDPVPVLDNFSPSKEPKRRDEDDEETLESLVASKGAAKS